MIFFKMIIQIIQIEKIIQHNMFFCFVFAVYDVLLICSIQISGVTMMRLQVTALAVFHRICIEWVIFRSAKNCVLFLSQSFREICGSVTDWIYFSTRNITLTLQSQHCMIKSMPFCVGYNLPISWVHNVFNAGKVKTFGWQWLSLKYDTTQFLIDKLTNLLCNPEIGIKVLGLVCITLTSARPQ